MSDDLNKKIQQVAELLGQDNVPDNVKDLLSLLTSSAGPEGSAPNAAGPAESKVDRAKRAELEESLQMAKRVSTVMSRLNNAKDPSVILLRSVKPFLNGARQKKLENCIRLLQLTQLTKLGLVDDQEIE